MKLDTAKFKPFAIDDKRFVVPGVKLVGECPKCRKPFVRDFGEHYLAHPKTNTPIDAQCWCSECDHEWTVKIRLNVSIALVEFTPPAAAERRKSTAAERSRLDEIQQAMNSLPASCIAATAKHALDRIGMLAMNDGVQISDLDAITDEDPNL